MQKLPLTKFLFAGVLLLLAGLTGSFVLYTPEKEPPTKDSKIQWMSFEEAVAAAKENPKPMFIDVYTDWCGWCKVMDKKTFSKPEIAAYMNEHYYNVKLDGEGKETINFQGHSFKYVASVQRGYHELAAALLQGKLSYPTVVFLDENQNMLSPVPGFQPPAQFDTIARYFGEGAYKSTTWEVWQQQYTSPLTNEGE